MEHELKTWPEYFEAVLSGNKRFEYRINDRNYQPGDVLHLREYRPEENEYTGREMYVNVLDVYSKIPGKPVAYVLMNIEPCDMTAPARTPTFGSKPYHFVEGKLYDRHGKEVDPGECVIFKVTDEDFGEALVLYHTLLVNDGHKENVRILIDEVSVWQDANPSRVKAAD